MKVRSHVGRVGWSAIAAVCAFVVLGAVRGAPRFPAALQASDQSGQSATPLAPLAANFTLEGPFTHENLSVYVVRGSTTDARAYITLDEGLTARSVAVREKGARAGQDQAEVNTLEIENTSDKWLFLQAGDIVKGGKQDRTITTDLLLAPNSGPQPIEAFCVERGRWSASPDGLAFTNSPGIVAGASLKRAIQSEKNQSRVWEEVSKAEGRAVKVARAAGDSVAADAPLSSTGTYNAIARNKTLSGSRDAYVAALLPHLEKHENAIGLAVAINGKVTSADVYRSAALFQRLSGKLLDSFALEALLARDATQPVLAPGKQQVTAFLSNSAAAAAATETVGESMQRSTRETDGAVMYQVRPPQSAGEREGRGRGRAPELSEEVAHRRGPEGLYSTWRRASTLLLPLAGGEFRLLSCIPQHDRPASRKDAIHGVAMRRVFWSASAVITLLLSSSATFHAQPPTSSGISLFCPSGSTRTAWPRSRSTAKATSGASAPLRRACRPAPTRSCRRRRAARFWNGSLQTDRCCT